MSNNPVIALTMGDPGGIGPEILVKALRKERPSKRLAYLLIEIGRASCRERVLRLV